MEIKFVDAHGHLNFPEYDPDRDLVVDRCRENGVLAVTVAVDKDSSERAVELSKKYPESLRATAGIHPIYTFGDETESKSDIESIKNSLKEFSLMPEVVAIGECGLDYARLPVGDELEIKKRQREIFISQIEIASIANKPLMIHCRDAYDDVLSILNEARKGGIDVKANFHFFSGGEENLKKILDAGDTVSFTGVITFADSYDSLVNYAPIDRILSETDCPYVTPVPYRGKRNEPTYVIEVVKRIATIKNLDFTTTSTNLLSNAHRVLKV